MTNSISAENHAKLELQHIQLELKNKRTHHFRSFVDQYFCYKNNHVNANGKADWEGIVWNGFMSIEASKTKSRQEVVKEHAIPLKVVTDELLKLSNKQEELDLETIARFLDTYVIFATISKAEDKRLRDAKLSRKMPDGFRQQGDPLFNDPFARYKAVEIPIIHVDNKSTEFRLFYPEIK